MRTLSESVRVVRSVVPAAALLLLTLLAPGRASGQAPVDVIKSSTWSAVFKTADGTPYPNNIRLNGPAGVFTTNAGTGRLSGVVYDVNQDEGVGTWEVVIRGRWALGAQGGPFRFNVTSRSPDTFDGRYGNDAGAGGTWTGTMAPAAPAGKTYDLLITNAYGEGIVARVVGQAEPSDRRVAINPDRSKKVLGVTAGNYGLIVWDSRGRVILKDSVELAGEINPDLTIADSGRPGEAMLVRAAPVLK